MRVATLRCVPFVTHFVVPRSCRLPRYHRVALRGVHTSALRRTLHAHGRTRRLRLCAPLVWWVGGSSSQLDHKAHTHHPYIYCMLGPPMITSTRPNVNGAVLVRLWCRSRTRGCQCARRCVRAGCAAGRLACTKYIRITGCINSQFAHQLRERAPRTRARTLQRYTCVIAPCISPRRAQRTWTCIGASVGATAIIQTTIVHSRVRSPRCRRNVCINTARVIICCCKYERPRYTCVRTYTYVGCSGAGRTPFSPMLAPYSGVLTRRLRQAFESARRHSRAAILKGYACNAERNRSNSNCGWTQYVHVYHHSLRVNATVARWHTRAYACGSEDVQRRSLYVIQSGW